MPKRVSSPRTLRLCLPQRCKHQGYMNVIPFLPDFAIIIKNIKKIRSLEAKEAKQTKEANQANEAQNIQKETNKQEIMIEPMIDHLQDSPRKLLEHQQTNLPGNSRERSPETIKPEVQFQAPKRRKERTVRKDSLKRKKRIRFPRIGKKKDQPSFTFFNSIEEYFV